MSSRLRAIVAIVVLVGCGGSPATRSIRGDDKTSVIDLAGVYERGATVPRDFENAAAIYQTACADGFADLTACRKLLDAILDARGVAFDRARAARLAVALCRRHDGLGCAIAALFGDREPEVKAELEHADPEAACARGDASACEAMLLFESPNYQGSSGLEAKQQARASLACHAHVMQGCLRMIESVRTCSYDPGADRCVAKIERDWTAYEARDQLDALARVRAECDRGDAVACDALPGREIPDAELCAAHDFTACAARGCLGDPAAAAIATAHGATANCAAVGSRDEARHAPPPRTRAALAAEPPLPAITAAKLPPFRSVAFRRLATEIDDWSWPSFEIANLGTRGIVRLQLSVYAYDRTGQQIARSPPQVIGPLTLAPGATITSGNLVGGGYVPDGAVAFDVCYDFISFEGQTRHANGGTTDAVGCPDSYAKGSGGAPLDGSGSFTQRRFHAAAHRGVTRYATTDGIPNGASAGGLAELAVHDVAFAGSELRATDAHTLNIPILISAIGIIYHVNGVTALRLSPSTLAKIFERDITRWNDPAIVADNPHTMLPHEPIVVLREIGWDGTTDHDVDGTWQLTAYLARSARRAWHLGTGAAFAWPADVQRASGLVGLVQMSEGAIAFVDVAEGNAQRVASYASIRNSAGTYVAPTTATMTAAARGFDDTTGVISANDPAAYPIAYASWIAVAAKQPDAARGALVIEYLHYLLGDGQQLLAGLGQSPLPGPVAARSRALVDRIALPH